MILYPYSTTALAAVAPRGIVPVLQAAAARRELIPVEGVDGLFEVPDTLKDVKPFFHPVTFESFGKNYMVIDTRACVRTSRDGARVVHNVPDYAGMVTRARLSMIWGSERRFEEFAQLGDVPLRTYSRVLADAVSRRLGMNPAEHMRMQILALFYYYSHFQEGGDVDVAELNSLAARIQRVSRIPAALVVEVLEGQNYPSSIGEFVELIKSSLGGVRAQELNPGLLYTMLGGIWFGTDAMNVVRTAIEYPPYFVAICYAAAKDRTYHKTILAKEIQLVNSRGRALADFTGAVENLMGDYSND